jgi:hypothetical protein
MVGSLQQQGRHHGKMCMYECLEGEGLCHELGLGSGSGGGIVS